MDIDEVYQRIIALKKSFINGENGLKGTIQSLPLMYSINQWKPSLFSGVAQCQEIVRYKAKLNEVYLLKGGEIVLQSADPTSGKQTFELVKVSVKDDNTLLLKWGENSHVARHLLGATHRHGIALYLGGNPLYTALASMRFNPLINKYFLAGLIQNQGVKMTICFTQELYIPADCDIVIEGYIQKNEEVTEEGVVFHASAVSQKKALLSPTPTKLNLDKIYLASLQIFVSEDITDLSFETKENGSKCATVKINKYSDFQAQQLLHSLWGAMELSEYNEITLIDNLTGATSSHQR